jgi:hypothetical protein
MKSDHWLWRLHCWLHWPAPPCAVGGGLRWLQTGAAALGMALKCRRIAERTPRHNH